MEIYSAAEDSWFFADFLKQHFASLKDKDKNLSYLDMGTGSGILAETVFASGVLKKNILCADVNPEAVEFVKKKGFNAFVSDLFLSEALKDKKFDLITFNAPYLPEHEFDKQVDTTGGKKGDEVLLRFLHQVKKYLTETGKCFFLVSSHTPLSRVIPNFEIVQVARKKLFFEELFIFELKI